MMGHDAGFVLGRSIWIFFVGLAVFLVLIPFFTAGIPGDSIFDIEVTHDQLKFRLINGNMIVPVTAAASAAGLVTGLSLFRFLQDKKEATIFLSLGMTRRELFVIRMAAAFSMLALMTAIPLAVSAGLNISALGGYQALVRNAVFCWAGIFLMAAVSCAVAVIACFLSGNLMETLIYWGTLISLPSVICCGLNMLMKKLYWGNAWGVSAYSGAEQIRESLLERYAHFNPLLFFKEALEKHGQFMRPLSTDVPESVPWTLVLAWLGVLALLTMWGGLLFRQWKAENSGITGNGGAMAELTAAATGAIAFAAAVSYLFDASEVLAFSGGVAVFAGVRLLWMKAGLYGKRMSGRRILWSCLQMLALCIVCVALATGLFNGTERFIEKGEITGAEVSYVGDPSYYYGTASGSSTGHGYYVMGEVELKDEASLEKVKALHMMFERRGRRDFLSSENTEDIVVPYDIIFSYTDEDGKEHIWYYDRASYGQLEEMLSIENLPEVREKQGEIFSGSGGAGTESMTEQTYETGGIYITDDCLTDTYQLTLGDDKRRELLAAIGKDISEMTAAERYFPEGKAAAVLMFSQVGDDDSSTFSYHLNNAFVYLTPEYENTIAWLEGNQLMAYVDDDPEIESITLQRMDPYIGINKPDYPMGMYFMSYRAGSEDEFVIQRDFGNQYVITDQEEITEVFSGLKNGYYMSGGGFLAAVKLAGADGYTYMFLPEDLVPSFIRG